mgnify:CR=1 FL=1
MKKLISIIALASIFAGFAATDHADAGDNYKYKYKYQYKNAYKPQRGFRFPVPRVHFYAPAPVFVAPPVIVAPPACSYVVEQVWIDPVYSQVFAGYDSCGTPIYHQVVVTPGCYRSAKYKVYPNGAREFVCYL